MGGLTAAREDVLRVLNGPDGEFARRLLGLNDPEPPAKEGTRTSSTEQQAKPNERKPVLVQMQTVAPQEVSWLWRPYVPAGKLTILEGDPGVGKSFLALQLAAIVSRGDPFPGQDGVPAERREPGTVIYLSAEDGLADTLRPRLDKVGADVGKVFVLTGWESTNSETGEKTIGAVSLAALDVIEAALQQVRPKLLVVDPIQAYVGPGIDFHRANEVRPVLAGLAALAEKYECAVLCIRHLGKGQQGRAIYRGLGSIDFAAAARSVLLVGQHPNDERRRVLAQVKNSLAPLGASLTFELQEQGFRWGGITDISADALLAAPETEDEKTALQEAIEFLRQTLADGPLPAQEVLAEARKCGIAERTIHRAKAQAGVKTKRQGEPGKRGGGTWYWYLDLDCQDAVLNEKPIKINVGNLNRNPQTLQRQGFQATDLDCHTATLIESPQSLQRRGFQGLDLDCQTERLGKKQQKAGDGTLNSVLPAGYEITDLRAIQEAAALFPPSEGRRSPFRCPRCGGTDFWQDARGLLHCSRCAPQRQ